MDAESSSKYNVTDIVRHSLRKFVNLSEFLINNIKGLPIVTVQCGQSFQYPTSVENNRLFSNYGIFMDYFIRKLLSDQFGFELIDEYTETVLKNPERYFKTPVKRKAIEPIVKHYEIYKNSRNKAMDIIESIKIVSVSCSLSFGDPLLNCRLDSNDSNLLQMVNYFKQLPYENVAIKTSVECDYFNGNCDIIFDNQVLYEIKTSQYESLRKNIKSISAESFYKLILYAFGHYKKTGVSIKCFKIYNPLLGNEHTMEVPGIDMALLESALKRDIEMLRSGKT